jgi:hypothetical protein
MWSAMKAKEPKISKAPTSWVAGTSISNPAPISVR